MESQALKSQTPKVYKINKLNSADFDNFNRSEYHVFLHLLSKIGGVDEKGKYLQPQNVPREYVLTAKEYAEMFDIPLTHGYQMLNVACHKLMKTDIKLERTDDNESWQINICSMAKYNKKEGKITIEFTDRIMPYLAQVKQKFLIYNLKDISNFKSLYTTRLYELLQEYKFTGWMEKSVQDLRKIFSVNNKFKKYADFKRNTFARACDEINENHDINLHFEEIKEGRKVVAVKFLFKKT
ncbi:unnamed protein product, partial [Heterosigma akashiwo]